MKAEEGPVECDVCGVGGPVQLFVLRYAGNVKPPEQWHGCPECYNHWSTDDYYKILSSCILCAPHDPSLCRIGNCYKWFCPHQDVYNGTDGTRCEKHLFEAECPLNKNH